MEIRPDIPEQDPENPAPLSERSVAGQRAAGIRPQKPFSWIWLASALAGGIIFGVGGLALVQMLAVPLAMLFLAVTIGSALMPLVDWVHSRRIPRPIAVVLVYAGLLLLIASVFGAMVPVVVQQTRALIDQSDVLLPRITEWMENFGFRQEDLMGAVTGQLGSATSYLFSVPMNIFSSVTEFFLIIFTSLFWALSAPRARRFALSFFPRGEQPRIGVVLANMARAMGGYVRGAAINGLAVGTTMYIGLSLIGLPFAAFLAVFAAMMEFFPVIGAVLSVGLATLVALSVSPTTALITLIFGIIIQQIESNILTPLVMRAQTEIPALLSIFAVVAGASIGGLLGALVAIPLMAALKVLVQMVIAPALRRANGADPDPDYEP